MSRLGFLKKHGYAMRRGFGVLMIAAALSIASGFDLKLASLGGTDPAQIYQSDGLLQGLETPAPAPEIAGITDWINSDPLTLQALKGRVVLIDFWTYSCINCIRTLPYVKKWYEAYKGDGFVVIGVHAPEFAFERKLENVQDAVLDYGITYPVALDNNVKTWNAYQNRYWPAHYLIDREGRLVYTHFGEGNYNVTEHNIRVLLGTKSKFSGEADVVRHPVGQSPETYLGYARAQNFVSPQGLVRDVQAIYTKPEALAPHQWALTGPWTASRKKVTSGDGAVLHYRFVAGEVHLVMGSADGEPIEVLVRLGGADVGMLIVSKQKLYTLVKAPAGAGLLEIIPQKAGLEAYAFTFGP
jgi:thiol-disulfide isomerase/thioredoxin